MFNSDYLSYQQCLRHPPEHLLHDHVYPDDPDMLFRLELDGSSLSHFSGWDLTAEEMAEGILYRMTTLLRCSMLHPVLQRTRAWMLCRHGWVRFFYDEHQLIYTYADVSGSYDDAWHPGRAAQQFVAGAGQEIPEGRTSVDAGAATMVEQPSDGSVISNYRAPAATAF